MRILDSTILKGNHHTSEHWTDVEQKVWISFISENLMSLLSSPSLETNKLKASHVCPEWVLMISDIPFLPPRRFQLSWVRNEDIKFYPRCISPTFVSRVCRWPEIPFHIVLQLSASEFVFITLYQGIQDPWIICSDAIASVEKFPSAFFT